jgi:hypothetical protein
MSHRNEVDEFEKNHAIQSGALILKNMRAEHERAARELALYEDRYQAVSSLSERAQLLRAAIAFFSNSVLPNNRLDLAAEAQAELYALARQEAAP